MTRTTADWRALLDGSTPGPWSYAWDGDVIESDGGKDVLWNSDCAVGWADKDIDVYLAASAPEAVAEVIRLREELEGLRDAVKSGHDSIGLKRSNLPLRATLAEIHQTLTQILKGGNNE